MYYGYNISDETAELARRAEEDCKDVFKGIEDNAMLVSSKVLSAFQHRRIEKHAILRRTGIGMQRNYTCNCK